MNDWWEAFWFFLPAGFANMAPVFANKIPGYRHWKTPLDFGKSYRGKRILGDNKTWRGLFFGVLVAVLVGLFQYRFIASSPQSIFFIVTVTALLGAGALIGDAVESFFKRQRGIASGESWLPYDQTDYIFGGILLVYPLIKLSAAQIAMIIIIYFFLHLITSYVGYRIGLKQKPI